MANINYSPIALFVYNRPWHTRQTVEALLANAEAAQTSLHIFSDAPRNAAASLAVAEVRSYVRSITGFKAVTVIERDTNLGLAGSIIDGVTKLCGEYGRAIVMEDDLVTSPYFLRFMNDGLDMYEADERVASIHGYIYPVNTSMPETFFLRGADCWGWGTWKRAWNLFEPDGFSLLQQLVERKLTYCFDLEGAYPYTKMLRDQIKGANDSWAIRWHASAFLANRLTLYSGRSLVHNIGNDNSGTHCSTTSQFAGDVADSPISVRPIFVAENEFSRTQIIRFHNVTRPHILHRAVRKLKNIIRRMM